MPETRSLAKQALSLAHQYDFSALRLTSTMLCEWCDVEDGHAADGLVVLRAAFEEYGTATGPRASACCLLARTSQTVTQRARTRSWTPRCDSCMRRRASNITTIKFAVSGKTGNYALDTANLPITATVVFAPPLATNGQCGETSATCVVTGGGNNLKCR